MDKPEIKTRVGGDSEHYDLHILVVLADEHDFARLAADDLDGNLEDCDVRVAIGLDHAAKALSGNCADDSKCLVPGVLISPRLGNADAAIKELKSHPVLEDRKSVV